MHILNHIVLVGVGLIGGSFVLDLKKQGLVRTVTGIDTDRDNLQRALERGVIDRASAVIDKNSIADADLIVIATPVASVSGILTALAPVLPAHAWISDVGSTKISVIEAFRRCLPDSIHRCIAAHPIAGSDRSGADSAQYGLFQNRKLIITPHGGEDSDGISLIENLWRAVGAEIYTMDAQKHDAVFAAVSHMPHLAAFAYVHQLFAWAGSWTLWKPSYLTGTAPPCTAILKKPKPRATAGLMKIDVQTASRPSQNRRRP